MNSVRAVAVACTFKATQIWPEQQIAHSQTRGWKKKAKNQIFALCQGERDSQMQTPWFCSLLLHSGLSVLPFSSPAHLEDKESACLSVSTSSAPAGWQAGPFPGYSSPWKRDLEKAASCILLAGGQEVTPLGRKKAPSIAMRM